MHPVKVRIHHWFVPNRLIWDNWENFITGGKDGNDNSIPPTKTPITVDQGSLYDYLGIPTGTYSPALPLSALPFRAYAKIFNENYRDQNLVDELEIGTGDSNDTTTPTDIQNVAWDKDYFTTARPWSQLGTEVTIPIGDFAPVTGIGMATAGTFPNTNTGIKDTSGDPGEDANWSQAAQLYLKGAGPGDVLPEIQADLSQATGISVNDLRLATAIQRYQEARAQYGSRYVEYLKHVGVRNPSDARLQDPEYLGGGRNTLQFSEVLQTSETTDGTPLATMAGHGIGAMRTNRFRRFFEEHGIVMTLMSVVPKTIYSSALPKKWSRQIKEDYFQKELQLIGEQEVHNREVQANHTEPDEVFGYQMRYDEYRYHPSSIHGEFRNELDFWHYARKFSGDVALNQSFTDCVPTKRVNADNANHCLYIMANHSVQARRPVVNYPYNRII